MPGRFAPAFFLMALFGGAALAEPAPGLPWAAADQPVAPRAGAKSKAKPAKAAAGSKVSAADLEQWKKALTGSESEALAALTEIGELGPEAAPAAPLVHGLLARGSSSKVLVRALEVAGRVAAPESSAAIAPYVQHRQPEIRIAAARALAKTGGQAAVTALRRALGSPDVGTRAAAAESLGALGAAEAVDDLFTVLGADVSEAAAAIGRLCKPEQCDRFMGLVGKLRFEVMQPGFVPLLLRSDAELPEMHKVRYVDRLRRLATKRASAVLQAARAWLPEDASPKLRSALDAALKERPIVGD